MQRIPCKYLLSLGFLLAALVLGAQESPEGRLSYIGDECILISGGQRRVYRPGDIDGEGLVLGGGDMLQTGPGGRFEIRLDSGDAVFTASENTFVQFRGFAEPEAASLELLYGRLRIANDTNREVRIKTGEGLVAFQQGDISLDYISQPAGSARPVLKIMVFTGAAELTPPGENKTIKAEANEMITVESLAPFVLAERTYIVPAPPPEPVPPPEPAAAVREIRYTPPDYSEIEKEARKKSAGIISGALFVIAGAVVQGVGFGYLGGGNNSQARILFSAGAVPMGVGLLTIFASFLPHSP
ncbi:MAG: hypothetical protein LBJ24_00555 [Treponema sp.]|jgi:hypothetical protein|nr:hypothetical protein [Treponema sp.]